MIPVSAEVIDLFRKNYRPLLHIDVAGVPGLTKLTDADLVENGFTVDRFAFSGETLEIGNAPEAEISVALDNSDGRFNAYDFDGAYLTVRLAIKKWDAHRWENAQLHYVPLGKYTVDDIEKNKSVITLNALDNVSKFDRYVGSLNLVFPATLGEILSYACEKCGVSLATPFFTNSTFKVAQKPDITDLTYRQLVMWVAELACTNAFADWNGDLCLSWFTDTDFTVTPKDRFDSDLSENTLTVTGVRVVSADETEYFDGSSEGAEIQIRGNALAQGDLKDLVQNIFAYSCGFSYLPYECETLPFPFLLPMDAITYQDSAGGMHQTIVSNSTFSLFGKTVLAGVGESKTQGGYAKGSDLTKREKYIIDQTKKQMESKLLDQYSNALLLNQIISGAIGLYRSEVKSDNGATVWYYHDKATLAKSTIIYTFNENGFTWTDDWNGGSPVWLYGMTKDGNAIYKMLSAYKIHADYIEAGTITADKIAAGAIGGFEIDETHMGIGKTAYDDANDGVYISPLGIGLGKGAFYVTPDGYLHADKGEFKGDVKGGTININDNFIVHEDGSVQLNGGITWGTGSSPTQVVYSNTAIAKPDDNTLWTSFPSTSSDSWHKTYSTVADYYASYTYDGGKTWTEAIKIRGSDGINGTNAEVTAENVFDALTNNSSMYGCFTALDGKLYINADYIRAGTVSSDLLFTGKLEAQDAYIKGEFSTTSGRYSVSISGGEIFVDAPFSVTHDIYQRYQLICFRGFDGTKYAVYVNGYIGDQLLEDGSFDFVYTGLTVDRVE